MQNSFIFTPDFPFNSLNSVSFTLQTKNFENKITMLKLCNTESSPNAKRLCLALISLYEFFS